MESRSLLVNATNRQRFQNWYVVKMLTIFGTAREVGKNFEDEKISLKLEFKILYKKKGREKQQ